MNWKFKVLFVFFGALVLAGCALRAVDVKPAQPYDFSYLHRMAKFSQAAYADEAAIRAAIWPLFDNVWVETVPATNNQYFLATSTTSHTQLLAIAGTANIENVLLDADFTREYSAQLGILLHRGFARGARLIYESVKSRLIPGYALQITGHSLGGAEALIVGMMLQKQGAPPQAIVTFGQPKVTDSAGVEAFADLPLTRVVNQDDIIPAMPIAPYGYSAPELVLFTGPQYSVVEKRPFDPAQLLAAWQSLQKRQAPTELPAHYIVNYLLNLESKFTSGQNVPYPENLVK